MTMVFTLKTTTVPVVDVQRNPVVSESFVVLSLSQIITLSIKQVEIDSQTLTMQTILDAFAIGCVDSGLLGCSPSLAECAVVARLEDVFDKTSNIMGEQCLIRP